MITKDITLYWLLRNYGWNLPVPKLRICEGGYNGCTCYNFPSDYDIRLGEEVGLTGMIIINSSIHDNESFLASAICHEWRHHMQYFSGISFNSASDLAREYLNPYSKIRRDPYSISSFRLLIKYISTPTEIDALEFQCKLVPEVKYPKELLGLVRGSRLSKYFNRLMYFLNYY